MGKDNGEKLLKDNRSVKVVKTALTFKIKIVALYITFIFYLVIE